MRFSSPAKLTIAIAASCRTRFRRPMPFSSCSNSNLPVPEDTSALAASLSLAADSKSLPLGMQLHAHMTKSGFAGVFSRNNLIRMYMKCLAIECARKVFDHMPERNLISWTLMVSSAALVGDPQLCLLLFSDMICDGFLPNEFALGSALKICSDLVAREMGMSIHAYSVKVGVETDPFFGSSMLIFYSRMGSIEEAESVFSSIENPDVVCWNAMVGAYVECSLALEAVAAISLMRTKCVRMDEFTFTNALKSCSLSGQDNYGRELHGLIVRSRTRLSLSMGNALLHMYLKVGRRNTACRVFNTMPVKDIITWNTTFSFVEDEINLVHLFRNFLWVEMKPNNNTFSILVRRCGDISSLGLGLQFCCLILHSGYFFDSKVTSSLINMFSKCGLMSMARSIFDYVSLKSTNNLNELIAGYNLSYCYAEAMRVFCHLSVLGVNADECTFSSILESCCSRENEKMGSQTHCVILKSGFSSHGYVCSSLVKVYASVGRRLDAFHCLRELKTSDLTCWGTLVSTLVHRGYSHEAIASLKYMMKHGNCPDEFILGSIFNACANIASLHQMECFHSLSIKMGYESNRYVASSVVDAYAKCGKIHSARMAFDLFSECKDVVVYNSMITGYAYNGLITEALEIFDKMRLVNLQPSQASFVSVISACSHMGFIDQGIFLFKSMVSDYGVQPSADVYGCIVDMLSRSGFLIHARTIIQEMPFPPWPGILRSLLSGSRVHGNIDISKWAFQEILQLVPDNDAARALLSNVYSEAASWEDAAFLRRDLTVNGLSKFHGESWIQLQ